MYVNPVKIHASSRLAPGNEHDSLSNTCQSPVSGHIFYGQTTYRRRCNRHIKLTLSYNSDRLKPSLETSNTSNYVKN